jgi:hypothetical protein
MQSVHLGILFAAVENCAENESVKFREIRVPLRCAICRKNVGEVEVAVTRRVKFIATVCRRCAQPPIVAQHRFALWQGRRK